MRVRVACSAACLIVLGTASTAGAQIINELRTDQPQADDDEYIELAGAPGTSLDTHFVIVLGDGQAGSGVVEAVIDLTGQSIGASGYFVAAESTFALGQADLVLPGNGLNFENGDNITVLVVTEFIGALQDDLDTDDDGALDVTPWTTELSRVAVIEEDNPPMDTEFHYGPPTVGPDMDEAGDPAAPFHIMRCDDSDPAGALVIAGRDPAGSGRGRDTPGLANACVDEPPDAGPGEPDAMPAPDAASQPDAGEPDNDDDGGCCSTSGRGATGHVMLALLIGALLYRRRTSR